MFRFLLAVLIIGGVVAFLGIEEIRLASEAKAQPTKMTCADLIAHGPGNNAHLELSDFILCDFAFVYQSNKNSSRWTKVWLPAVPVGGEFHQAVQQKLAADGGKLKGDMPLPKNIRVIVTSSQVPDEAALGRLADSKTMTGMVINKIASLGAEEKRILRESYPGVDFDTCYIFSHGRHPASAAQSFGMLGGGVLLAALGGWGLLRQWFPATPAPAPVAPPRVAAPGPEGPTARKPITFVRRKP